MRLRHHLTPDLVALYDAVCDLTEATCRRPAVDLTPHLAQVGLRLRDLCEWRDYPAPQLWEPAPLVPNIAGIWRDMEVLTRVPRRAGLKGRMLMHEARIDATCRMWTRIAAMRQAGHTFNDEWLVLMTADLDDARKEDTVCRLS